MSSIYFPIEWFELWCYYSAKKNHAKEETPENSQRFHVFIVIAAL